MRLKDPEGLKREFLDVSTPGTSKYGKHLSLQQVQERFGPAAAEKKAVVEFLQQIPGATVHGWDLPGDMLQVEAPVSAVEQSLQTKLSYRVLQHQKGASRMRILKADAPIYLPEHLHQFVSFISLNTPITHVEKSAAKSNSGIESEAIGTRLTSDGKASILNPRGSVAVSRGNEEAILTFPLYCTAGQLNDYYPPCPDYNLSLAVSVYSYAPASSASDLVLQNSNPTVFTFDKSALYCANTYTAATCGVNGVGTDAKNCNCMLNVCMEINLHFDITYILI